MSVLVTHAHNRLAYYTTRCLAKHGIKVTCASEFPLAASFFSRYCTDHFTYPSPWTKPEQFVEKILEEIEKRDIEVLMPVHREGYVLSKHKDRLEKLAMFPCSSYEKIISICDKRLLNETARKAGVRTPKTMTPRNRDEVEEARSTLRFPIILKLPRSHGSIGISIVNETDRLVDRYLETVRKFNLQSSTDQPIIQEFISGEVIEWEMLFNHGKLIAKHSYLTPRDYLRIEFEDHLASRDLKKLGDYLKWHGILSGSIIIEDGTYLPYLTDVNARFNGGLSLAIMSGVEFPYLLYKMITDETVDLIRNQKKGLTNRWLWGDLADIPKYIERNEWKHIIEILGCQAPLDFWEPNDPAPFLTIPIYYLTQLIQHGTMRPLIEKY